MVRNKWNLYHKLNFSYPFFFYLRPFKARNCVSPFGSRGNYKGLDHQQVHTVLKLNVWNIFSCMFSVFTASLLKKTRDVPKCLSLYAVSWYLFWLVYFKPVISLSMIYYPAMYSFTSMKNVSISPSVCGMLIKEIQIR